MSVQAIAWVLEYSLTRGVTRLVMIAIANHIDATGEGWTYVDEVRRMARCSEKSYFRARAAAEELGELTVEENGGGRLKTRNGYRPNLFVFPHMIAQLAEIRGGQNVHPSPSARGGQVVHPSPGLIRNDPSFTRPLPMGGGFEARAEDVVAAWIGRTTPVPGEDPALVETAVSDLLGKGWTADEVALALDDANVATKNALLVQLRRRRKERPETYAERAAEQERRRPGPAPDEQGPPLSPEDTQAAIRLLRQARGRSRQSDQIEGD